MSSLVKEVFDDLWNELSELRLRTMLLEQLYSSSESLVLLKRFGGSVFEVIFELLLDDVVLRLSKISDPATTGKNQNASLYRLVDFVEAEEAGLADRLGIKALRDNLKDRTKNLRELRNRVIAHKDWGRRDHPLPSTSRAEIQAATEIAHRVLRTVSFHFSKADLDFNVWIQDGYGEKLLYYLGELARRLDAEGEPS